MRWGAALCAHGAGCAWSWRKPVSSKASQGTAGTARPSDMKMLFPGSGPLGVKEEMSSAGFPVMAVSPCPEASSPLSSLFSLSRASPPALRSARTPQRSMAAHRGSCYRAAPSKSTATGPLQLNVTSENTTHLTGEGWSYFLSWTCQRLAFPVTFPMSPPDKTQTTYKYILETETLSLLQALR